MLEVSVPQNLVDDLRNAFLKEIAAKNNDCNIYYHLTIST